MPANIFTFNVQTRHVASVKRNQLAKYPSQSTLNSKVIPQTQTRTPDQLLYPGHYNDRL